MRIAAVDSVSGLPRPGRAVLLTAAKRARKAGAAQLPQSRTPRRAAAA